MHPLTFGEGLSHAVRERRPSLIGPFGPAQSMPQDQFVATATCSSENLYRVPRPPVPAGGPAAASTLREQDFCQRRGLVTYLTTTLGDIGGDHLDAELLEASAIDGDRLLAAPGVAVDRLR